MHIDWLLFLLIFFDELLFLLICGERISSKIFFIEGIVYFINGAKYYEVYALIGENCFEDFFFMIFFSNEIVTTGRRII